MAIAPSSAVTLAGAEQAVRAGIAAAQKSGVEWDEKILTLQKWVLEAQTLQSIVTPFEHWRGNVERS